MVRQALRDPGYINSVAALRRKKGAVEEDLVKTVTKPQGKAVVPDKTVTWALEGRQEDPLGASGPEGNPPKNPDASLGRVHFGSDAIPGGGLGKVERPPTHLPQGVGHAT